ncbi:MAG: HDOD domain-containing protein [Verrucomicrobiota bacterium]
MQELRSKGHLPALDGNVGAVCTLTNDPLTCIADLTAVILRDCSLTSNLIATANSALYGAAEPIKTVSAAINTMGFETIRSLAIGLGIVKEMSGCAQNRNLYRLFAAAYFSGVLATSLGQRLNKEAPEELFVSGLLAGLPRLLLAYAFPDKYASMEKEVLGGERDLNSACLNAFGVTYSEVAVEIATFWKLPSSVIRVLQGQDRIDPDLALVRQASRISDMVFGNARGGTAAIKAEEKKLQTLMRDETFRLAEFIPQTCTEDHNITRFFKLTRQDVEMMVRIAEWGRVNPAEVANSLSFGTANQELNHASAEDPALIVGQILTDLTMAARCVTDINEILLTSMEGIYRCLRPSCVLVAFANQPKRRLDGRLCLGSARRGPPVSEFQAPLDNDLSPVVRCLSQKKSLAASASRDLPLPFLKGLNVDYLWLVPIVAFGRAIGLYLIAREVALPFTRQEEAWSDAMVEHVSIAFERMKSARAVPANVN